jgi:hypothetical protein
VAAWGFVIEGRRVLLHMMAGSKEDVETVIAFFEDVKRRGLKDPPCDLGRCQSEQAALGRNRGPEGAAQGRNIARR